jgi:hypothetical protein
LFRNEIRNGHDPTSRNSRDKLWRKIEDHLRRVLRLSKEEKLALRCNNC